ncbi:MAG: phage tail assembly protein [Caulobacteraceae bacterium]|nr:phage tail assembly protein [Caulobacteraceae bacterium]
MATQDQIDDLPDTFELAPRKPIEFGGQAYTVLVLREPTAGQLKEISRLSDMEATIMLLALSAGVPPGVIEKLGARDLGKGAAFLQSFTQDAQPTGDDD